jgi:hypothetical protein
MTPTAVPKRSWAELCADTEFWTEHYEGDELVLEVNTSKNLFEFARIWAMWAEGQKATFPASWRSPHLAEPWAMIAIMIARGASNSIGGYKHDLENDPAWAVGPETDELHRQAAIAQQMLDILNGNDLWGWEGSIFPVCKDPDNDSEILKWADCFREHQEAFEAGRLPHQMDIAAGKRVCVAIIQRAEKAEAALPERRKAQKALATAEYRAEYRLTRGAIGLWTGELFQPQPKKIPKKLVALLADLRKLAGARVVGDDQLEKTLRNHLKDASRRLDLLGRVLKPIP